MDFNSLLSVASQNKETIRAEKRYSLAVGPPKRDPKVKGVHSAAVQAFLRRRDEDERKKAVEDEKRKAELLAKRSELKTTRKARAMASRTKDNFHGYNGIPVVEKEKPTRQQREADQQQKKDHEARCTSGSSDGDRRNVHIKRPAQEFSTAAIPSKRPRPDASTSARNQERMPGSAATPRDKVTKAGKASSKAAPSPSLSFTELLKLAEKKQHEPVPLVPKAPPVKKEVDTSGLTPLEIRQREYLDTLLKKREKEKGQPGDKRETKEEIRDSRESREGSRGHVSAGKPTTEGKAAVPVRLNGSSSASAKMSRPSSSSSPLLASSASHKGPSKPVLIKQGQEKKESSTLGPSKQSNGEELRSKSQQQPARTLGKPPHGSSKPFNSLAAKPGVERQGAKPGSSHRQPGSSHGQPGSSQGPLRPAQGLPKPAQGPPRPAQGPSKAAGAVQASKQAEPRRLDTGPRLGVQPSGPREGSGGVVGSQPRCTVVSETVSTRDLAQKQQQQQRAAALAGRSLPRGPPQGAMLPPRGPPPGGPMGRRPGPPMAYRGPPPGMAPPHRRRIEDDEEEDEYDSDMDDFIDDEEVPQDDISRHIQEIFGYDRGKYKYESDSVLRSMETSWREQQKEEARSLRLGVMEDQEDIKKEEEEKKRKMLKDLKNKKVK